MISWNVEWGIIIIKRLSAYTFTNKMDDEVNLDNLDLSQKMDIMLKQNFAITKQLKQQETQLKQQETQLGEIVHNFNTLNTRLNAVETTQKSNTDRIDDLSTQRLADTTKIIDTASKLSDVQESCKFVSTQYDDLLTTITALKLTNTTQEGLIKQRGKECAELQTQINDLKNEFGQERLHNDSQHQYYRTCFHLKLCGVPLQPSEEEQSTTPCNFATLKVIEDVCAAANVNLNVNTIDVCHRLGSEPTSPIIIRFCTKSARFHIYNQRSNFNSITSGDVTFTTIQAPEQNDNSTRGARGGRGGNGRGGNRGKYNMRSSTRTSTASAASANTKIYIQEHLTKNNKSLLSAAKTKLAASYKYPGYVKNGTIRAKVDDGSQFVVIRSAADIEKLLDPVVATDELSNANVDTMTPPNG